MDNILDFEVSKTWNKTCLERMALGTSEDEGDKLVS